jgi:endonuclease/exonuclease/phosphatase (EEP) superfamily protein YafD
MAHAEMLLRRAPLAAVETLGLIVIAASVLPFGAKLWWVLDLPSHFRVQYLGAALGMLVLFALLRRMRWCIALALVAALNLIVIRDYLPTFGRTAPAPSSLRVMTVNLSGLDYDSDRLLASVRAESPDVLVLVELTPHSERWLAELDELYPNRFKRPATGAFGIGMWSRHPFENVREIALGETPVIEARVAAPFGALNVLGVHLRSPISRRLSLARNRQLTQLAELRSTFTGPLVITGDFNITPFSPIFADWLRDTGLRDARAERGFDFSWPAFLPIVGIPIDHCIVSDEFRVIAHRRLPAFGSDHYPVVAELALR